MRVREKDKCGTDGMSDMVAWHIATRDILSQLCTEHAMFYALAWIMLTGSVLKNERSSKHEYIDEHKSVERSGRSARCK